MRILIRKIIGLSLVFTLLISQAGSTYAIYSPTISAEVSIIKSHVFAARQVHGTGSFRSIFETAADPNVGLFNYFGSTLKEMFFHSFIDSFLDGFWLLIASFHPSKKIMTACRRDDIWELQAIAEEVLNELFKAALMSDNANASQLFADYNTLKELEAYLKYDFKNEAFFPDSQNFYIDCPHNEFMSAFEDIKEAWDRMYETFLGGGAFSGLGGLAEAAKKRAKRNAAKWIKENQLTLSFGGTKGSNPKSLLNFERLEGLAADFRTSMEAIKEFVEAIWPDFTSDVENITTVHEIYREVKEKKELALNQAETALKFQLSLNDVAENSLKSIEWTMLEINSTIQRAFTTKTGPETVQTFCKQLSKLVKTQCKNKATDVAKCK